MLKFIDYSGPKLKGKLIIAGVGVNDAIENRLPFKINLWYVHRGSAKNGTLLLEDKNIYI